MSLHKTFDCLTIFMAIPWYFKQQKRKKDKKYQIMHDALSVIPFNEIMKLLYYKWCFTKEPVDLFWEEKNN